MFTSDHAARAALLLAAWLGSAVAPAQGAVGEQGAASDLGTARDSGAASDVPAPTTTLTDRLDAAVRSVAREHFFGAVLVARGGEILLARGYGTSEGQPVTPDTLFDVASVGKQFTAALVLLLEDRGLLDTDASIAKYLPDVPEDKRGITVHHLLTHQSGLVRDVELSPAQREDRDLSVAHVLATPLAHEPGDFHSYSNVGYLLLAAIVERSGRRPFEDQLIRLLFEKAEMTDSGVVGSEHLDRSRAAYRNEERIPTEHRDTAVDWAWHWGFRGAAGVVTSARDLYRWDRALQNGEVLPDRVRSKFRSPGADGYGLGWEAKRTARRTLRLGHTGRCYGFRALFIRYPDEDACIVVVANPGIPLGALDVDLSRVLFEARPGAERLAPLTGRFELPCGDAFEVFEAEGRLRIAPRGAEAAARLLHGERVSGGDKLNRRANANHVVALLQPLRKRMRGSDTFSTDLDADAHATLRARWDTLCAARGRCRAITFLGGDPETGTMWVETAHRDAPQRWVVRLGSDRRIAQFTPDDSAEPPLAFEFRWRRDTRFAALARDGKHEIEAEFASDQRRRALLWSDRDTGGTPLRCNSAR